MPAVPSKLSGVTALTMANVYFDGNVVSHTLLMPDGTRKTLGLMRPGSYHFKTDAAELMEVVDGSCRVTVDGSAAAAPFGAGSSFKVPAKSGFLVEVDKGLCQYICSFLG